MSIYSDAKDSGGVYVRPLFVQLAGDLVAGTLLSQLAYWFAPDSKGKSKLKVTIDGKKMLAKSREDLCTECCMTLEQYKRAVKVLIAKGYVQTCLKLYAGKVTPHFWLDEEKMQWDWLKAQMFDEGDLEPKSVKSAPEPAVPFTTIGVSCPNPLEDNAPTHWSENPQTCLEGLTPIITESEIEQEQTTDIHTYASQPKPIPKGFVEYLHPPQWKQGLAMPWSADLPFAHGVPKGYTIEETCDILGVPYQEIQMKAADILAMKKQPNGGTATLTWQKLMGDKYGFQKPLTMKQVGQLKQIATHAGAQTIPLLEYVIPNWQTVAAYVKTKVKAGTTVPPQPEIGFMLFYLNLFVQLIADIVDEEENGVEPKPKVKYVTEMPEEVQDE